MARFVVLRHEGPQGLHWDFLLETGDVLRSWALPQAPEPGVETACQSLPDHRLAYLDYQGPVSGERGTVTRWDRGTYTIERQTDSELVVELRGARLTGRATLERSREAPDRWHVRFTGVA